MSLRRAALRKIHSSRTPEVGATRGSNSTQLVVTSRITEHPITLLCLVSETSTVARKASSQTHWTASQSESPPSTASIGTTTRTATGGLADRMKRLIGSPPTRIPLGNRATNVSMPSQSLPLPLLAATSLVIRTRSTKIRTHWLLTCAASRAFIFS